MNSSGVVEDFKLLILSMISVCIALISYLNFIYFLTYSLARWLQLPPRAIMNFSSVFVIHIVSLPFWHILNILRYEE